MRFVDNNDFMKRISDISDQVKGLNYTVFNKNDVSNDDKIIEYRKNELEKDIVQFLHEIELGMYK